MLELLFVIHRMMIIHPILWKIGDMIFSIYKSYRGLPSVARNKGASLVETPFVLFLDADMFFPGYNNIESMYLGVLFIQDGFINL